MRVVFCFFSPSYTRSYLSKGIEKNSWIHQTRPTIQCLCVSVSDSLETCWYLSQAPRGRKGDHLPGGESSLYETMYTQNNIETARGWQNSFGYLWFQSSNYSQQMESVWEMQLSSSLWVTVTSCLDQWCCKDLSLLDVNIQESVGTCGRVMAISGTMNIVDRFPRVSQPLPKHEDHRFCSIDKCSKS